MARAAAISRIGPGRNQTEKLATTAMPTSAMKARFVGSFSLPSIPTAPLIQTVRKPPSAPIAMPMRCGALRPTRTAISAPMPNADSSHAAKRKSDAVQSTSAVKRIAMAGRQNSANRALQPVIRHPFHTILCVVPVTSSISLLSVCRGLRLGADAPGRHEQFVSNG